MYIFFLSSPSCDNRDSDIKITNTRHH